MLFSQENLKRIIVAVIALPIFYLYITKLPPVFFLFLLTAVSALAQMEFHAMYKTKRWLSFTGIISGILYFISSAFSLQPSAFFILSFILISSARLFFIKDPSSSLRDISPAVTGFLYIPNLLLTQWYLRLQGHEWILFLYGCVWASDSLAYYIGKGIGKRKLYKEVSPNKTVAGAFGSVAGGIFSALLLGRLLLIPEHGNIPALLLMGGAIGSVTIVGDLVESMFKRDAGVKDSGSFIPGHGGILDKIDGVLFAGPVLYWITLIL
ncbi:MAG: phosphatidate cytidylyltransferase [Nitrospirota bacterium]